MLKKLSDKLEKYTGEEVVYKILILKVSGKDRRPLSEGEPIWTLLVEENI